MELASPAFEATYERLRARFGPPVERWWERLPDALDDLAARWRLAVGAPVGRGNTSLVLRCQGFDGRAAILKVTPDAEIAGAEAWALRSWSPSRRVPEVWGYEPKIGALLLEAIPSETPLAERHASVRVADIAELIAALHRSGPPVATDGVVSLAERVEFVFDHWIERYGRNPAVTSVVAIERLRRGHALAQGLLTMQTERVVLLHGDLHAGNVLDGGVERGLVAIDPRPCVGDPATDAVDWVFWLADEPAHWRLRSRELALALAIDGDRLWEWCRAFAAMLAASAAAHGGSSAHVEALLMLAP